MYIVQLSSKSKDNDIILLEVEVNTSNEKDAISYAIDYYYLNFWTNTNHRNDEINIEINKFINKLNSISNDTLLGYIPNKDIIINEYTKELRKKFGCTDISINDFKEMTILDKIDYLLDIGCELTYFSYSKKDKRKFIKI